MNKLKINLGQAEAILKKSNRLIGVKLRANARTLPKGLDDKKLYHRYLGGFRIYKVSGGMKKLDKVLDKVRKHRNVLQGTHVYFTDTSDKPIVPSGKIFVSFDSKSKKRDRLKLLKKLKLDRDRNIGTSQMVVSTTKKSANPLKCCIYLKESELVLNANPDFDFPMELYDEFTMPSSNLFPLQWHLENKGAAPGEPRGKIVKGADMKVVKAWQLLGNKGSNKIRIAVIDNGFHLNHPAYRDKIAAKFSIFTPAFLEHGSGHGTSCAGLAAASETADGIIGVAPNAELLLVDGTTFSWDSLERVFKFCMDNGADVISCSWGGLSFPMGRDPMHDIVLQEITTKGRNGKGCPVLFAAGNENAEHLNVMGQLKNVICVGGTTSADEHLDVSNRGNEISVSAPGGGWPLIAPKAHWDDSYWADGKERGGLGLYRHFAGTSASTPLAAGVVALMLSANPDLTALEVKNILERTADKIGNDNEYVNGHSIRFGHGRINAERAVQECLRLKNPSSVLPDLNAGTGGGLYRFRVDPLPSRGWGIQTGALREYGNVLKMVDQLQNLFGRKVIININELNGQPNYKVILGPFDTKREAKAFQVKVNAKGFSSFLTNLKKLK